MDRSVPAPAAILLAFIYKTETKTAAPACYNVIFGRNQAKLAKPLTTMTLGEVIDQQKSWTRRFKSSAAGAPQFMRATLQGLVKELKLSLAQKLDADMQDRLAFHLLKRRGYEAFMAGKISRTEFGKRLSMEWASFPVLAPTRGAHRDVPRGSSYYMGDRLNKALVSPEKVEAVLDRVKAAGNVVVTVPEPVVIEKPVVVDPGELETPASKSKTVWTWLLTAIGAPIAAFGNLDWRVQLAIVAVIVGFAIYGIKRRADLARAVRDLKTEFGG